jgi:hypothetical protein
MEIPLGDFKAKVGNQQLRTTVYTKSVMVMILPAYKMQKSWLSRLMVAYGPTRITLEEDTAPLGPARINK